MHVGSVRAGVGAAKGAPALRVSRRGPDYGDADGSARARRGAGGSRVTLLSKLRMQMFSTFWQGWIRRAERLGL